ncbi:hypothetical protein ACVILL_002662 [Bradyrhizobium sp. USDA 3364]
MPMPASGYHRPGSVHKDDEGRRAGALRRPCGQITREEACERNAAQTLNVFLNY